MKKTLVQFVGWAVLCMSLLQCHSKVPSVVVKPPVVVPDTMHLSEPVVAVDSSSKSSLELVGGGLTIDTVDVPLDPLLIKTSSFEERYQLDADNKIPITVYKLKLDTVHIALLNGQYKSLNLLQQRHPKDYSMLTNAGMFHPEGVPVGLFRTDSVELVGLNTQNAHGNFFLKPNGVFYVTEDQQAGVLETQVFLDSIYKKETPLTLATQSGPMLVIDGQHHPKFNPDSPNKYIRNGVGITDHQEVIFILSGQAINLYTFAEIFLAKGCKNALYLDGAISSMYIKDRADDIQAFNTPYGPVLGIYPRHDSLPNHPTVAPPLQQTPLPDTTTALDSLSLLSSPRKSANHVPQN